MGLRWTAVTVLLIVCWVLFVGLLIVRPLGQLFW